MELKRLILFILGDALKIEIPPPLSCGYIDVAFPFINVKFSIVVLDNLLFPLFSLKIVIIEFNPDPSIIVCSIDSP